MGAEFKDCHLYLTYFRLAWEQFKEKHAEEYNEAASVLATNLDILCIFNTFESRLPTVLDFSEHTHYQNVDILQYVIARMAIALDSDGRTGYRRCIMHFLHDLQAFSEDLRNLLLSNINSLCGVHIERLHAMLTAVIAAVHNRSSEQDAINNACRDYCFLKVSHTLIRSLAHTITHPHTHRWRTCITNSITEHKNLSDIQDPNNYLSTRPSGLKRVLRSSVPN